MKQSPARITVRRSTDPSIGPAWDGLLREVPWASPQHALGFGRALASSFGYLEAESLVFSSHGRPVAGLPLIRMRVAPALRALYSAVFDMFGGPFVHPDHGEDQALLRAISVAIDAEARRSAAFEAKLCLSPLTPAPVVAATADSAGATRLERDCPMLRLAGSLEETRAGYRSAARRGVAKSQREEVSIDERPRLEDLHRAYPLYRDRMQALGATAKPWRFVEALVREKIATPLLARRRGRTIGMLVLLRCPAMAVYWLSAIDPDASPWRPMNALVDAAIRGCHERGIGVFNFGRSQYGRPGLVRFKGSWGAETFGETVVVRTYRPRLQRAWRAVEPTARRTYATWDLWVHGDRPADQSR